jgi:hypothetical protein
MIAGGSACATKPTQQLAARVGRLVRLPLTGPVLERLMDMPPIFP